MSINSSINIQNLLQHNQSSAIISEYSWLLNNKYLHYVQHGTSPKSSIYKGKIKDHHLKMLNSILNPETHHLFLFVNNREVKRKLFEAIENVVVRLIDTVSLSGKFIFLV